RDWLAESGFDPVYGARPLKRVIQRNIQDPLAEQILAGTVLDGQAVTVTADEAGLKVNGVAINRPSFGRAGSRSGANTDDPDSPPAGALLN
ncbi:MAG: hypothetical protein AAGH38_08930, partial [Pseudomonadota bacterium]